MKKSSLVLSLVGFGISILALCLLFLIPLFMGPDALYTLAGLGSRFGQLFSGLFSFPNVQFIQVVWLVAFAILLCFWIAGIVVASLRKRKAAIGGLILFLVEFLTFLFFCALAFQPGWDLTEEPFWALGANFSTLESSFSSWGPYGLVGLVLYAKKGNLLGNGWTVFILVSIFLGVLGFLLSFVGYVMDMATSGKEKAQKKAIPAGVSAKPNEGTSNPSVIIVHDDEACGEGADKKVEASTPLAEETKPNIPASTFMPNPSGIQGPLLVQYINTYSPDAPSSSKASSNAVPVSEIQGAISGEKPLSAEDVRKIVREELLPKEEKQPVIISVPSPVNSKEEKPLSAEDVRKILSEELKKNRDGEKEGDIIIEDESEPAPRPLNEEDVRSIIAEAKLDAAPVQKKEAASKEEPAPSTEDIRKMISEEIRKAMPAEQKQEVAPALTAEDIRGIMKEEFDRRDGKNREALTAASVRQIIRQEMKDVPPLTDTKVQPITVVLSSPAEKQTEITKEAFETPTPEKEVEASKPRVVGAVNPDLPPHDKIIRIPFQTRMKSAEPSMAKNYNELKSEIMSYGVKSRISNKGDTFRLHKVTFVRITVAGKALKLYFALDPKDYANSPLPIQDVSHKKVYADIPLVFKVKSDLSMKRAKDLISDVMKKNGLTQGAVETKDWISEIPEADAETMDDSEEE